MKSVPGFEAGNAFTHSMSEHPRLVRRLPLDLQYQFCSFAAWLSSPVETLQDQGHSTVLLKRSERFATTGQIYLSTSHMDPFPLLQTIFPIVHRLPPASCNPQRTIWHL